MEIFVTGTLSYPDLFERGRPPKDKPDQPGRYAAQLIFEKNSPAHIAIRDAMIAAAKAKWPDGWQNIIASLEQNKKCLRDGNKYLDKKGLIRPEYKDKLYLKASNKEAVPLIHPKAKKPNGEWNYIENRAGRLYAGCIATLKIEVYAMDEHGNAINATLLGAQHAGDGKAFGGSQGSADGFGDAEGADAADNFGEEVGEEVGGRSDDLGI